jgi:hypothetical protein
MRSTFQNPLEVYLDISIAEPTAHSLSNPIRVVYAPIQVVPTIRAWALTRKSC